MVGVGGADTWTSMPKRLSTRLEGPRLGRELPFWWQLGGAPGAGTLTLCGSAASSSPSAGCPTSALCKLLKILSRTCASERPQTHYLHLT